MVEVQEKEEEYEVGVSLIRKKKDADDISQKCTQLLAYVIFDQSEKHLETSKVGNQETDVFDEFKFSKVRTAEVMVGLKYVVYEAFDVPREFFNHILQNTLYSFVDESIDVEN